MAINRAPLRIGNASGFYGDRFSAVREMLGGGPLDVLTGDYLAELTMLILGRAKMKDPEGGYATTFLRQLEDSLALAVERGTKIVTNAGGLNPRGLAARIEELAQRLGRSGIKVAYVEGDDLLPRAKELSLADGPYGAPLTANAYLGAWGIAECLRAGADVVVTGRVTDASLVVGPAAAHFGWARDDWDALAGATAAGHVIECGAQATGGNFAFFRELPDLTAPLGFPIAEIHQDGSSVITKHPDTGGAVTTETVTAQLLYEIGGPLYLGPDVATRFDTIRLEQEGPDRVRISGVQGTPPPATTKVCLNHLGGFRNEMTFVLTGLDIEAKADWARAQLEAALAENRPAHLEWQLARTDHSDAAEEQVASALLRCVVKDRDQAKVGRVFSSAAVELALASYPGFTMTAPPGNGTPYGVYTPAYVPSTEIDHTAVLPDGTRTAIPPTPSDATPDHRPGDHDPAPTTASPQARSAPSDPTPAVRPSAPAAIPTPRTVSPSAPTATPSMPSASPSAPAVSASVGDSGSGTSGGFAAVVGEGGKTRWVPLGLVAGARSGDKGGDANIGVWARTEAQWEWLEGFLTTERLQALLPETQGLDIARHVLPHLRAVNFVVYGLLQEGVSASTRFDPQGKALGEWLRSRVVEIPEGLV